MKTSITHIIFAGCAAVIMAGSAAAGETGDFKASFKYDKAAPVSTTYKAFKKDARRICRSQIGRSGARSLRDANIPQRACEQDLLAKAVKAANMPALTAYYLNRGAQSRKYASTK